MLSFQDLYRKGQTITEDNTAATLTQLKQDINQGYQKINATVSRYFTRKQKFADIVASQQYYQTPIDAIRVTEVVATVSSSFVPPLVEVKSEHEWRLLNIFPQYSSNYIRNYWVDGNNQIGLFPIPSQSVTAGLRYVYQPKDVFMTKADYSTGTVSISNGASTVTGASTVWGATHVGMFLQVTNDTDGNWYEIDTIPGNTSLTLITPYAGPTVSNATYRLGQLMSIPDEYSDVPLDYALMRYFESRNNPERAKYHQLNFDQSTKRAEAEYASTSTSRVITNEEVGLNPWWLPPIVGT